MHSTPSLVRIIANFLYYKEIPVCFEMSCISFNSTESFKRNTDEIKKLLIKE